MITRGVARKLSKRKWLIMNKLIMQNRNMEILKRKKRKRKISFNIKEKKTLLNQRRNSTKKSFLQQGTYFFIGKVYQQIIKFHAFFTMISIIGTVV